ncbi:hypothetical protein Adt_36354 [Abeliophyllum distichum]|uniref:Uncharacterized protein n=1 Tax=Abeliophyllum distichum TaxID=126358 RepID=A0ABD1QHM3_9LAMI
MVVASTSERCKEGSFAACPIGSSIQLKFLVKDGIKSQRSDNQVHLYNCSGCTSNQWRTVDTIEGIGPSNLSEKFSNGTSTIDIDDGCFDDPNSSDEADSHRPKVSTIFFEQYDLISHQINSYHIITVISYLGDSIMVKSDLCC